MVRFTDSCVSTESVWSIMLGVDQGGVSGKPIHLSSPISEMDYRSSRTPPSVGCIEVEVSTILSCTECNSIWEKGNHSSIELKRLFLPGFLHYIFFSCVQMNVDENTPNTGFICFSRTFHSVYSASFIHRLGVSIQKSV